MYESKGGGACGNFDVISYICTNYICYMIIEVGNLASRMTGSQRVKED